MAVFIETAQQRIAHGSGLVVDFLLHEGVISALFRSCGIPLDLERLALGRLAVVVSNLNLVRGDGHHLVVVHLHGGLGVVDEPRNVRPQEVFSLTQADNQRRVTARCHNTVSLVGVNSEEGKRTFKARAGQLHRLGEILTGLVVEDVCQ